MFAEVTMFSGKKYTVVGKPVSDLFSYFTQSKGLYAAPSLGWLCGSNYALNLTQAESIIFKEGEPTGETNAA